jgi:hypothetical protein
MTTITELENIVHYYEHRIEQLKEYSKELEVLDSTGFDNETNEIKKHLKDPKSVDLVRKLMYTLKQKISEKIIIKENQISQNTIEEGIRNLIIKNKNIYIEDIKLALTNKNFNEALKLLKDRQTSYNNFLKLIEEEKEADLKIKKLTKRVANGDLDSDSFKKARDDIDHEKKDIAEQLWTLRTKLFKEDYEKPF